MSVRIDIQQDRTVEEGPLYRVATSVIYNSGIDRNVFVFNTTTEEFEHVATTWDMEHLPKSKDDAALAGDGFYRLPSVTKDFDTVMTATEFAIYTRGRVAALVREYEAVSTTFEGSGTYTYTG